MPKQQLSFLSLFVACLLLCGSAIARTGDTAFTTIPATPEHIRLLRTGGYVLYMRHGSTDARFPDRLPINLDDCASQRPLSAEGLAQLEKIRVNFVRLQVPYQQVVSSPFCRARESARRVFGEPVQVDTPLRYTATMTTADKQPAVERTRYWISLPVETEGSNRVVVAHGPNVAELMEYLPPEATMVIFRPLGLDQGFRYVASIEPKHWPELLSALEHEAHP